MNIGTENKFSGLGSDDLINFSSSVAVSTVNDLQIQQIQVGD